MNGILLNVAMCGIRLLQAWLTNRPNRGKILAKLPETVTSESFKNVTEVQTSLFHKRLHVSWILTISETFLFGNHKVQVESFI
jgi:hypothetical protein